MNRTVKHPRSVLPQAIPRFENNGFATSGIPAPIIERKKSLLASAEATYAGYAAPLSSG